MRKFIVAVLLALVPTFAWAQGPGPGPVPSPFIQSGSAIYPQSSSACLTFPRAVSGGCQGAGSVNIGSLYVGGVAVTGTGNLTPSTTVTGIASGSILYNNSGTLGGLLSSGTGNVMRATAPTASALTVTGSFTATGLVTNGDLVNPATTVNGQTCTLGSTCTVTAAATGITVGTTTVGGGTTGRVLYDNAGALGEMTTSGTGTQLALTASPTFSGTIGGTLTFSGAATLSSTLTYGGTTFAASATGSGSLVGATSPTLVTPALGTPSAAVLTNATGLPISSGVSGLGTGVATFLATPTSANLAAAITNETGSGALVFATSPTLVTPVLGAATATSINGLTLTSSTGTLSVTNGKTLSASNTLTFAGTDSSTLNIGTGGTLGTAAYQNTGTSGANIPFLNGTNTWASGQTFSSTTTFNGQPTVNNQVLRLFVAGLNTSVSYGDNSDNWAAGFVSGTGYVISNSSTVGSNNKITVSTSAVALGVAATGTSLSMTSGLTTYNATAIPAGGTTGTCNKFSSTSNFGVCFGSGAPTLSAAQGSLYLSSAGAPYWNNNGSTGWSQVPTTTTITTYASGFVSAVRNGGMTVWPKGTSNVTIQTTNVNAGLIAASGWAVLVTGGGSDFILADRDVGYNGSPYSMKITGHSGVTNVVVGQRLENSDGNKVQGANATFQMTIYNGTGGTITPTLATRYAGSTNNWTSPVTDLAATNLQSCADATVCTLSYTFAVSASAANGYEVKLDFGNNFSTNGKFVRISAVDLRSTPGLTPGLNSSPPLPEVRDVNSDYLRCARYFQTSYGNTVAPGTATNAGMVGGSIFLNGVIASLQQYRFPIPMSSAPTMRYYDGNGTVAANARIASSGGTTYVQGGVYSQAIFGEDVTGFTMGYGAVDGTYYTHYQAYSDYW